MRVVEQRLKAHRAELAKLDASAGGVLLSREPPELLKPRALTMKPGPDQQCCALKPKTKIIEKMRKVLEGVEKEQQEIYNKAFAKTKVLMPHTQ